MKTLEQFKTALSFFAHPDDETLGAGATIKKLRRMGVDVHVAIPGTGIYARRNEHEKQKMDDDLFLLRKDCAYALSHLDIERDKIYLGHFSDNEMDKHTRLELIHWLEGIIEKVKPDVIFTHHRYCTNIDHQYCHEAAVVATRPDISRHITVLAGEVPSSTGYLKPTGWDPDLFIDVTKDDIEAKIRSMEAYKGEARPDPHPRSPEVLRALAKVRGSEAGFMFAEAFKIQKLFG
ncbi:MAG: PIG-L deacetylase family protein [bacterium]|nr:PIG-L deacetylase family protein [bacterium]